MAEMTFAQAVRSALAAELARDPAVFLLGEDIGRHGGVFKATDGLLAEFGATRVRDTPISELGVTAAAVGSALAVDHRVLDGVEAAAFLDTLRRQLERADSDA
jgi:acetoin:2,6-dichlorophenolindophenol oxidoreductase subunit beta